MSKNPSKVTYTRFAYSVIEFFTSEISLSSDVSSYIQNIENEECRLATSRIGRFIQRNRTCESNNRLLLAISLNDMGTKQDGREILRSITDELLDKFLDSSCIDVLKQIDENANIETFSTRNFHSLTDYVIIVFNVSNASSIECIISTDSITSKLIERDEDGEVVEFNSRLHKNLKSFKDHLK